MTRLVPFYYKVYGEDIWVRVGMLAIIGPLKDTFRRTISKPNNVETFSLIKRHLGWSIERDATGTPLEIWEYCYIRLVEKDFIRDYTEKEDDSWLDL